MVCDIITCPPSWGMSEHWSIHTFLKATASHDPACKKKKRENLFQGKDCWYRNVLHVCVSTVKKWVVGIWYLLAFMSLWHLIQTRPVCFFCFSIWSWKDPVTEKGTVLSFFYCIIQLNSPTLTRKWTLFMAFVMLSITQIYHIAKNGEDSPLWLNAVYISW